MWRGCARANSYIVDSLIVDISADHDLVCSAYGAHVIACASINITIFYNLYYANVILLLSK